VTPYNAVLLIAFGGPEKFEDVRPFLANVLRGRPVPPERIETVVEQYRAIGGKSPLNEITVRQALALAGQLAECRLPLPVYIGMRNWTPYLSETLHRMREDGVYRALAIVMAPHRSPASWEKYREAAEAARLGLNAADAPELVYADAWHEHPLFIEAVADRVREAQAPDDAVWIFTAHSIPSEQDRVSGYSRQIRKTAELVAQKLGRSEWHLAFQSRSGNPQEEWLDPDVGDFIAELAGILAAEGHVNRPDSFRAQRRIRDGAGGGIAVVLDRSSCYLDSREGGKLCRRLVANPSLYVHFFRAHTRRRMGGSGYRRLADQHDPRRTSLRV
jgi:ferrochelatase